MRFFFDEHLLISRMSDEDNDLSEYQTVTYGFGHLQPASEEKANLTGGVFGKSYRVYFPDYVDILEGDRIRDSNGNWYTVKDIVKRDYGAFNYIEVVIYKTD